MSYILDALRRADQQRQRHAAPTLLTLQPSAEVRKRPAYLVYVLLAAVLIGAGIVIGWWRPWQTPQPVRTESAVVVKPVESTPPQQAPAPSIAASQPNQEAAAQSASQPAPATTDAPVAKSEAKPQNQTPAKAVAGMPSSDANATTGKTTPSSSERLAYTPAGEAPEQPIIAMAELPQGVRAEIPAMTISVHAWSSNPAASMISINYKLLHEGDQVAPGLLLDKITQDGAVFTYKGYRFSRGLK